MTARSQYRLRTDMRLVLMLLVSLLLLLFPSPINAASPTISSVSPTAGGPGTSVTISGSGFGATQGTSTVKFNGTVASPASWSDTAIVAGVPAAATTGNVVVRVSGTDSNGVPFVVLPIPGITGLSPNFGAVGASVTISGANFGSSRGLSTVAFSGKASTPTSWSATVIVAPVPAGATTGNVVVTVNGIPSNGVLFTVVPAPNITSLSPSSGAIGTSVTISGTSFGSTQGASTVKFNGTLATPASWSATSIVVPVPTGATTGDVVVHASGVDSNVQSFTVLPNITSLSPASGAVGTSVTIAGTSFGPTQGTSTVTFNGVAATIFNWTDTTVIASVPMGVGVGPNPVVLTVAGNGASNAATFTVLPGIIRVSPAIAPVGASVNIRGTNFGSSQGSSTITFNSLPVTPANWTDTSVVAQVPSGVTTGSVVAHVGGYDSNAVSFTVAASISSVSPLLGSAGTPVTITGLNFGATQGTSKVLFNGLPAAPTSWANTAIVVPVPTGALTGPITVVSGGASSNGVLFEVSPAISSLSPISGSAGTSVTIKGSNFGSQAAGAVFFNGTSTSATSWTPTSIVAPVPVGATTGPVVITVNGIASNGVQFTIGSGTIAGVVTNASNSTAVSGALVQALQANAVSGSATTASDGSYSIANLAANTYDVRVSATGFGTTIRAGNVVTVNATTTVNVSLSAPGTLSGKVTQADGVTAIGGATVTAAQGTTSAGTATTDTSGNYSISVLSAGNYTAQASASGYTSQTQNSVTITSGNTTTANFSLPGQPVITYTYDELGRLVGVVNSLSDAATYQYDAVGNLLSITRNPSSQASIIDFTPKSGPVGTGVTISGTGFSATPSQNSVSFHGTSASVTSTTTTQISTTVPAGATTGTISVTAPSGTAASTNAFTVTGGTGAPTITSFTPDRGVSGNAVTVTGTNFDANPTNDYLQFNLSRALISSATDTSLSTTLPSAAGSGRIAVSTAKGKAVSTQDFFVPFGNYVAADIGFTGRMAVNTTQSISIGTAGKIGVMLFDGTAGQNVSIVTSNGSFSSCTLLLLDPYGRQLSNSGCSGSSSGFMDAQPLQYTGTYAIGIDPQSTTGSVSVTLYAFTDVTGTVAPGAATNLSIASPGQNARFTFGGAAGQRASVNVTNWTNNQCYFGSGGTVRILNPDGSTLASTVLCNGTGFLDAVTLPTTGTYTVMFDPSGSATGTATLTLYLFADVTGTLTPGTPATVNITYPGQNWLYSFSGTAGQRASVNVTNWTNNQCYSGSGGTVRILNPDGGTLASTVMCNGTGFVDAVTLPTTGTYTAMFDPSGSATGTATLTLYLFADVTGTLTPGTPATVNITYPGQNWLYSFSGTAGQRASVNVTNWTNNQCYFGSGGTVRILNPDGSTLASTVLCNGTGTISPVALPNTGTYTVMFDPYGTATGSATLTLTLN